MHEAKEKGFLSKTACSSLQCPRMKRYMQGELETFTLDKNEALRDLAGNYWCAECSKRCDFLNWGHRHHWPEVTCGIYTVAKGYTFWRALAGMGSDVCIEAFWQGLAMGEQREEQVS